MSQISGDPLSSILPQGAGHGRVSPGPAAGRPERDPAANPWLINFANYLCAGGLGTPPRGGGWANLTVSLALRWPVAATETTRPVIQGVVGSFRLILCTLNDVSWCC